MTIPSLLHSPSGIQPPILCSHSPSKFPRHPHPRQSIHWQGFLASKDSNTKAYSYLKTTIMVLACSWKSMETIRYQCPIMVVLLKCFSSILLHVSIPLLLSELSYLSKEDMDNNDVIYYAKVMCNIVGAISFLSYLQNKFDRKHGIHPAFIDENLRVLDETEMNVKYLLHVHQRESQRKTMRDWLESVKYLDHYPIDLNQCFFGHNSCCALEKVIP